MHPSDTATISITRNHPEDIQDRPVYIWVDGEKQGILRYNATMAVAVTAGRHRIKAHNTLFGHTIDVEAAAGAVVRLKCANGLTGGGMMMVLMLGVAYLRVRLTLDPARA
jgi:hypothetical protein